MIIIKSVAATIGTLFVVSLIILGLFTLNNRFPIAGITITSIALSMIAYGVFGLFYTSFKDKDSAPPES